MKRFVLGMGLLGLMMPSVASAALSLSVQDLSYTPGSFPTGTQYLDLIFQETGAAAVEDLSTYDIGMLLTRPAGVTGGIRIVQPANLTERNALARANDTTINPYVFEAASVTVVPLEPSEDNTARIQLNFDNLGDLADIRPGQSAGRIPFVVDANATPGLYRFNLDPLNTTFAGFSESIAVAIDDAGNVTIVPEPAGLSLLGLAGLLALRRRRTA